MRIKRFEAKNSSAAMALIKEEMGDDAVILATKELGSRAGGQPRVEVVAAIDYDLDELTIPPVTQDNSPSHRASPVEDSYGYKTIRRKTGKINLPEMGKSPGAAVGNRPLEKGPMTEIQSEARDLRKRFADILRPSRPAKDVARPTIFPSAVPKPPPKNRQKPNPEDVAIWRQRLLEKISFSTFSPTTAAGRGAIIALVGATGVGKTTTAAKLAAWYSLRQGHKVCLLSMDCYRIGATDQLRTYARIMRLPCEVVLRKTGLEKALQRHTDKIVIIDTAGKSPYDPGHINELQQWFGAAGEIDPHLVIDATTKKEDIQQIIKVYRTLGVGSLILTKLDETRAYASLCHQVVASQTPISYLCTGQRVPEDFQVAGREYLETLFKGGESAGALL